MIPDNRLTLSEWRGLGIAFDEELKFNKQHADPWHNQAYCIQQIIQSYDQTVQGSCITIV